MSTSGTYNFAPTLGELTIYAFGLIGIRPTALLHEHMEGARMAANLLLGRWSPMPGVNTWQVDLQTVDLVPGTATYSVPANTIAMLDAYVSVSNGVETINRLILPISRSEYASYPQPNQQGSVTVFWFDKLLSPTFTLYLVPDGTQASLSYYRVRQSQDSVLSGGLSVELPVYWLEAFAMGLAARLAMQWKPEMAVALKAAADEAYSIAADQNTETQQFYIS